jgi:2',3'-cyclic-nucleotide 2'-phosphodiesterase (5'-nucleotidase family)
MVTLRKVYRYSLVAPLLVLFVAGCGTKEVPEGTVISFLYTSDVRGKLEGCGCKHNGGGITRRSAEVAAAREEDPTVVYCDAGNFMTGTPEVDSTRGLLSIEAYNLLGANVANVSERELALGVEAFKSAKKQAKFAFVSANLRDHGSTLTDAYVVRNVKEAKVAFIGLCGTADAMNSDSLRLPAGVTVDDPVTALRKAVASVQNKAQIIVVLSTCGDGMDSILAHQCPQVTLIIGGRSYRPNAQAPWTVGNTRIMRAPRDGRSLGRMDLVFGAKNDIKTYSPSSAAMEAAGRSDPKMLALIRKYIPTFVDNPAEGVRIARAEGTTK